MSGLLFLNGARTMKLSFGRLAHMLVAPLCVECQTNPMFPLDWWNHCPHNYGQTVDRKDFPLAYNGVGGCPWIGLEEGSVVRPRIEDGRITGTTTEKVFTPKPNFQKVSMEERTGSGSQVEYAKVVKGYREPEELGIAPFCDFADCMAQSTEDGTPFDPAAYTHMVIYPETGYTVMVCLCRDIEYRLAVMNARGKPIEVLHAGKRADQLASAV